MAVTQEEKSGKISASVDGGRAEGLACADWERGPPSALAEILYCIWWLNLKYGRDGKHAKELNESITVSAVVVNHHRFAFVVITFCLRTFS